MSMTAALWWVNVVSAIQHTDSDTISLKAKRWAVIKKSIYGSIHPVSCVCLTQGRDRSCVKKSFTITRSNSAFCNLVVSTVTSQEEGPDKIFAFFKKSLPGFYPELALYLIFSVKEFKPKRF